MKQRATLKIPPKNVFQFLCDASVFEECSRWKITACNKPFGVGYTWTETKWLAKREWEVTEFDRRGLRYVAMWGELAMTIQVKKGGTWACNVSLDLDGPAALQRKFARTDGQRLEKLLQLLTDD